MCVRSLRSAVHVRWTTFGGPRSVDHVLRNTFSGHRSVDHVQRSTLGTTPSRREEAQERWRSFGIDNESLEDSANLPAPDVIAAEIAEDLRAALEQFEAIQADLAGKAVPKWKTGPRGDGDFRNGLIGMEAG